MSIKLPPVNKVWLILLGILIVGFVSMTFNNSYKNEVLPASVMGNSDTTISKKDSDQWSMMDYEDYYESTMKDILEEIIGVGEVIVKVNLDSTEQKVYQTNTRIGTQVTEEKDSQGGNRTIDDSSRDETVVTISNGSVETPVEVKTVKPTIRGVVVVAEGAENTKVKSWIFDVIQRSLDVPAHRISIVPKKMTQ